jgi:hypothetical protein
VVEQQGIEHAAEQEEWARHGALAGAPQRGVGLGEMMGAHQLVNIAQDLRAACGFGARTGAGRAGRQRDGAVRCGWGYGVPPGIELATVGARR